MALTHLNGTSTGLSGTGLGAQRPLLGSRDGAAYVGDYMLMQALAGRIFAASDADQNDAVTGQTSFANTTPTFLLNVPSGTTAIPLWVNLQQSGSVAGDFITVIIEIDNIAAYASGGTSETVLSTRVDAPVANVATLYSGATATAGYGVSLYHATMAEDVDPASADAQFFGPVLWRPAAPVILVGPASLKVFTFAGTTGPTWLWSIGWCELASGVV